MVKVHAPMSSGKIGKGVAASVASQRVGEEYKVSGVCKHLVLMEEGGAKGGSGTAVNGKNSRICLIRIIIRRLNHISIQLQSLICKGKFLHRKHISLGYNGIVKGSQLLLFFPVKAVRLCKTHVAHSRKVYRIAAKINGMDAALSVHQRLQISIGIKPPDDRLLS